MNVRVGVIGLGVMGRHHTRILHDMDGVELLGVADANPTALSRTTRGRDIRGYTDFTQMLSQQSLDLVVTSDTAVAHLAGGLNVRVWVALPFAPDWRWLLGRDNSRWYPSLRLFRQERRGDWAGVFARMAQVAERKLSEPRP